MSLISSTIPNFVNGVSQQPFTLRLNSQGERQENALSTASSGLRKRPPTEHLARINMTPLDDAFIHMVNRDDSEKYQVLITSGSIRVFDLAGNEKPLVNLAISYLETALPASRSFALTTVADYTFVVNRTMVVAASPSVVPARPAEAIVSVKLGNYGKTYRILIDGVSQAFFETPDGSDAAAGTPKQVEAVATDYIAMQLHADLLAAGFNTAPWSLGLFGSTIVLSRTDGTDFTIDSEDGFGNEAMKALKGKVQRFTDLPPNPQVDGFTIEVVGDQATDFDNYWVQFTGSGAAGSWKETVAPGTPVGLDASTMPHQRVREADGTFTFKASDWDDRTAGDIDSSPNPSFVGRKINDVFFLQNRLGFLSDENFIQSETGKYFNLFRTTVSTLLDSDPVDASAATNKVAILEHAVAFNEQMLLFSSQQQFLVDSTMMTPRKVPIKPTTDFMANMAAKPVAAGRNVYFTTNKGKWSAVREFYAQENNVGNDAIDITSHVPRYVPSNIVKIAAGQAEDVLVLMSGDDRSRLFIYKYYFSATEKLQSSWSEFNFSAGGTILACDFVGSTLYLVVSRASGVYLEKMDFSLGASTDGEPYQVLLDRKIQLPLAALSFDGTYTIINPDYFSYPANDGEYMVVAQGGGTIKPGQVASVVNDAGTLKVKGDFRASILTFGVRYTWRYTLSKLVVRAPVAGGGMRVETGGRTQVRTVSFSYSETGFMKVIVTPEARQSYTYTFSGRLLGTSSSEIGGVVLPTGTWSVPVRSRNTTVEITLESDMPLPVSLLSADWEAFFVKRSSQV